MASSNASSSAMLNAASPAPELMSNQEFMNNKVTKQRSLVSSWFLRFFAVNFYSDLRTKFLNFTVRTIRLARVAAAAAMPDEPVTEQRPLFLRHEPHQLLLDFHGVHLFRQAKAVGEPRDMRVHDHADVDAERVS